MEYFQSDNIIKAIRDVYGYELALKPRVEETGEGSIELRDGDKRQVNDLLDEVGKSFPSKDFPYVFAVIIRVRAFANSGCNFQELYTRVLALRETLEDELRGRKLVLVPALKADYCDKEDLFGVKVSSAFPSAVRDIKEAGNCYAVDLNTACVFHLMRVLEKGLMTLATPLGVAYDSENRDTLLERIEAAIAPIEKLLSQDRPAQLVDLQVYGEVSKELSYFKNPWRHYVVRSSLNYEQQEALKIMNHVREFMQHLSLRHSD
jgi:hypothetical protein